MGFSMSNLSKVQKFLYHKSDNLIFLRIDLWAKGLQFIVDWDSTPRKTSEFAEMNKVAFAINGDQFTFRGGAVRPSGFWAVHGQAYAGDSNEPILYLSKKNVPSFKKPKQIWNAISGNHILANKHEVVNTTDYNVFPRTAIGWNNRYMYWAVVDGNEKQRTGMSLNALALMMMGLGCHFVINMDGGGSSTFVASYNGKYMVMNTPSDDNVPGKERPVANFLGVR